MPTIMSILMVLMVSVVVVALVSLLSVIVNSVALTNRVDYMEEYDQSMTASSPEPEGS